MWLVPANHLRICTPLNGLERTPLGDSSRLSRTPGQGHSRTKVLGRHRQGERVGACKATISALRLSTTLLFSLSSTLLLFSSTLLRSSSTEDLGVEVGVGVLSQGRVTVVPAGICRRIYSLIDARTFTVIGTRVHSARGRRRTRLPRIGHITQRENSSKARSTSTSSHTR